MQTSDLGSGETRVLPSDPVILFACAIKFSFSKSVEFAKVEGSKVLKMVRRFPLSLSEFSQMALEDWEARKRLGR